MQIKITPSAIQRVKELIAKNNNKLFGLRVAVDSGGCAGFMYDYQLISSTEKDDYILEIDSIKVVIDPISQEFLNNCTIDFTQELGSSYFHIINPKASSKCGCGSSFSL
ncbi:MAG TPA: iron-sulfur cluster assembly accessory protein [Candidatus Megaira endosymbiont of Nemacystus decipiens]|nr:iron-sulfur cluster assembly accessory protein [Candidatus Megaera endosymbiont of Nemacystus decipiens]